MGLIKEFREFAVKGNMMDMAVGIIIGGAFGILVRSMVDDLIMPIASIPGKADFANYYIGLTEKVRQANADTGVPLPLDEARELGPVFAYGNFITVLLNFVIMAFAVFLIVKAMNTARRHFEEEKKVEAAAPPVPPAEVQLLTEIRDELRSKRVE